MEAFFVLCVVILSLTSSGHTQEISNGAMECYAGSIVCDDGYLYTKDDPNFHCGQMERGECRRYIWSGEEANERRTRETGFPVPRVPSPGWSVCVTAAPTRFTRVTIDFMGAEDRKIVSHFDIRMSGNHGSRFDESVVINEAEKDMNGDYVWGQEDIFYPRPYPFAAREEFTVKIVAFNEHTLTYYANGKHVATRGIPNSIREVTKVVVLEDVSISQVNVWCV